MKKLQDIEQEIDSHTLALTSLIPVRDYLKKKKTKRVVKKDNFIGAKGYTDKEWEIQQRWNELEIPSLNRYDMSKKKYDIIKIKEKEETSLLNKITWVLTAVNVAILISLVIKNI